MTPDTVQLIDQLERSRDQLAISTAALEFIPDKRRALACTKLARSIDKDIRDLIRLAGGW